MIRLTVHYAGRVQGVGFRYSTTQVAGRHRVAGFVQNLPDGRVRLVAEGAPPDVHAFLDDVRDRLARYITDAAQDQTPATGEFGDPDDDDTFTVRY